MKQEKKNHLGLTEKELQKAIDALDGAESPDKFRLNPELQKLIGQFEGLIESFENEIIIERDDGVTVKFTREVIGVDGVSPSHNEDKVEV